MSHPLAVGVALGAMLGVGVIVASNVVTTWWYNAVYIKRQP